MTRAPDREPGPRIALTRAASDYGGTNPQRRKLRPSLRLLSERRGTETFPCVSERGAIVRSAITLCLLAVLTSELGTL